MTRELYTHVCIYSSHRAHSSSPEPTRCVRNSIANHKPTPNRPKDTTYLKRHLLVSVRPRYVSLDHMPIVQPRILSASIDNRKDARCSYDNLMSLRRSTRPAIHNVGTSRNSETRASHLRMRGSCQDSCTSGSHA